MTSHLAPPQTPPGAPRLLDLLRRQRDGYQSLKDLADQQQALIAQGRAERLLALLAQRQTVLDRLTEVSRQIDPYRDQLTAIVDAAEQDEAQQIQGLVAEVQDLLQSIIQQDQRDTADLQTARDGVQQQIRHSKTAGSVAAAYGRQPTPGRDPRFTDQQG